MATANSKTINGITFSNINQSIAKLANPEHDVVYEVIGINGNTTKYNSYVITIQKYGQDESFKVYMPEYVAKHATLVNKFIYEGLQIKKDKPGHSYHRVLWAK